jgi:hypothetical protein
LEPAGASGWSVAAADRSGREGGTHWQSVQACQLKALPLASRCAKDAAVRFGPEQKYGHAMLQSLSVHHFQLGRLAEVSPDHLAREVRRPACRCSSGELGRLAQLGQEALQALGARQ